ncbi:MAG: ABC transporter substrate-binding protein [Cellulomonas sp.]
MKGSRAMKRLACGAAGLMLVLALLPGCAGSTPATATAAGTTAAATPSVEPSAVKTTIRIASLKGPTTMGLVKLTSDAEAGQGKQDYEASMYGTPDEIVPQLMKGDVDVALLPANLASVLYNKLEATPGSQLEVAAINTLGMLEVLESGDTVKTIADLKGKTIYSTGKGASPEYVLDYLLKQNGLDPATDVSVEYKSEATEVAAVLASTPGAIGVLPQPYVTVLKAKSPAIRTALTLTDEWAKLTKDSQMVTGVLVVRRAFADANPAAFADFLTDYKASTEFTNTNPAQAAPLIAAVGIVPSAQVAEAAIPACNITYIVGAALKTTLSGYLKVLFAADPASVGGSLPGDDFYFGS